MFIMPTSLDEIDLIYCDNNRWIEISEQIIQEAIKHKNAIGNN